MRATGPFTIPGDRSVCPATATKVERIEFAAAYREHSRAVYGLARAAVGPAAAEDVTQDVFLRLWSRPDRFDATRGSLRAYLLAMARCRAIDLIRSESARSERQRRDGLETRRVIAGIDDELLERDDAATVRSALHRLNPKVRASITFAFFGGLTYREVALALGEPEGTIKSRIRDGLAQMRSMLQWTELDDLMLSGRPSETSYSLQERGS